MSCWHLVSVSYKWGPSGLAGVYCHPCVLFLIGSPGDESFGSSLETPAAGRFRERVSKSDPECSWIPGGFQIISTSNMMQDYDP